MNKKYNGAIDFWKFIFCLIILFFHIGETYGGKNYYFEWGMYAVEFFFVVSGYFMCVSAESAERKNTGKSLGRETFCFIMHKITRILPAYLFCYLLAFVKWFIYSGYDILVGKGFQIFFRTVVKMLPNFLLVYMCGVYGKEIIRITWYISAMLIAMLVIYPLVRKFKDSYMLIAAPIVVMLTSGYFAATTHYNGILQYTGLMPHGLERAFIGINLGCIVYMFSNYIKQYDFTRLSRVLLSIAEIGGYLTIIYLMDASGRNCAYIINIFLLFTVAITASKKSGISGLFDNKLSKFLGEMSLYIYLCQSPARGFIGKLYPKLSYGKGFIYITVLSLVFAIAGYVIVHLCTAVAEKSKGRLKKYFIKETING